MFRLLLFCISALVFILGSGVVVHGGGEQVEALLQFKKSIVDEFGHLASWKESNSSPCEWERITCISGEVVRIDLGSRNLSGTVSGDDVCKLPGLTSLSLSNNSFFGGFPVGILNCKKLVVLELQRNAFGGELPDNISLLSSSLEYLDLSYNGFTGTIPKNIGNLEQLQNFNIWNCRFVGPLPGELGKLGKLMNLTLSYNNLGPELPQELRNLKRLRSIMCGGCGLSGSVPAWLGELKELDFLELTYNSLSGSIPVELMHLPKLTKLELYSNALTGSIPREIGNLTSLTDLDLNSNQLSGSIPEELMSIRGLQLIHLWNNSLSGSIPVGIAELPALYDVALFQNHLTGSIPPQLGSKCSLQVFDVSSNNLSGTIPPSLCNGGRLWRFILFTNSFSGSLPAEYGACESLIRVRIFGNGFAGPVPDGLWGAPRMLILDITDNQFEGGIGDEIGDAAQLQHLRVFGNRLRGGLPASIGRLQQLYELVASNNELSGGIPRDLGRCTGLTNLLLDGNQFEGSIPGELGGLSKLQYLSLAENRLSGSIPGELGELANLISLDLSRNELGGRIPAELGKLRLPEFTEFNLSYNRLVGLVPFHVNEGVFGTSFLGNPGLCLPRSNSDSSSSSCREELSSEVKKGKRSPGLLAWVTGAVLAFAATASFLASCWFYRQYKALVNKEREGKASDLELVWTMTPFQKLSFSEEDVLASLDEDNVIGCGGAGKVYKASLKNGQSLAVKKLWSTTPAAKERGSSGDYGFRAEIESLGRIRHFNIVRLLCCCSNAETNLLVYDYLPNGSLGDLLHSTKGSVLDWPARYRIALGAAQGLSYLHHDCVPPILHRDVKSNNILLSEEFDGMLADFGLAKLLEGPEGDGYSVSKLTGSLGYIAPEYAHKLKVNEKSDIYSFGVVLLELLTGRRPVDARFGEDGTDIVRWVCGKIQSREDVMGVFDKRIVGARPKDLMLVLKLSLHCTSEVPSNRPSMREVVRMLEEVDPNRYQDEKDEKEKSVAIKVVY